MEIQCFVTILIVSIYLYQNYILNKMLDTLSLQYCSQDMVSNFNSYVKFTSIMNMIIVSMLLSQLIITDLNDNGWFWGTFIVLVLVNELYKIGIFNCIQVEMNKSTCTNNNNCTNDCSLLNMNTPYYLSIIFMDIIYLIFIIMSPKIKEKKEDLNKGRIIELINIKEKKKNIIV